LSPSHSHQVQKVFVAALKTAITWTLEASCQLQEIVPLGYLRDPFILLLLSWPMFGSLELASANWQQPLADPETHRPLPANVCRQASMGAPVSQQITL